jgi:hypothetical protein
MAWGGKRKGENTRMLGILVVVGTSFSLPSLAQREADPEPGQGGHEMTLWVMPAAKRGNLYRWHDTNGLIHVQDSYQADAELMAIPDPNTLPPLKRRRPGPP